jgi:glycosyltransferase involved in cell wall biosynthesis
MADHALTIHFVHSGPTPHNNYLLDALASMPGITLHRHYLFGPTHIPGRPWKGMKAGDVQTERIRTSVGARFDSTLLRLALLDRKSVFFVIGWDFPVLVWFLLIVGLRGRPLIMWDDGPSEESLAAIDRRWDIRQIIKRRLIRVINRSPGTYFHTGNVTREPILGLGIHPDKLENLPFFVTPGTRSPELRAQHGATDDVCLFVAGGRLMPEKGYDLYVEALGLMKQRGIQGWKAVLIGSGAEQDRLHAMAARLDLADSLDFVPWAEPELFANYVHSCDVFVAPARFDHFPTTVIAAMQAGTAVVATDGVGSAVEFINSPSNGLVVKAGDATALAQALESLVADPHRRRDMGMAAHETMAQWPVERGAKAIADAAMKAQQACAA